MGGEDTTRLRIGGGLRYLTDKELREGHDTAEIRERSLRLERETGADSIATIDRLYDRTARGGIRCVFPGCTVARHDPVMMWRHVHGPAHRPKGMSGG